MNTPLKFLVTSGGTKVPLDDVRAITNFSQGTTGALIAEELLHTHHHVIYVSPKDAKQPLRHSLQIDPEKDISQETKRVAQLVATYQQLKENLQTVHVESFDEYYTTTLALLEHETPDVMIMSMAASDYGVQKREGKIRTQDDLVITLHPLPKVIDAVTQKVKSLHKRVFLVGFKYLVNVSEHELIETAYASLLRSQQDLCVANMPSTPGSKKFCTYILTREKSIIPVPDRNDLPKVLLQEITERLASGGHYMTHLTKVESLPIAPALLETFLQTTKKLAYLGLFEPYTQTSQAEFGFVAKRTDQGTLITGRGSSKSASDTYDCTLITQVDTNNLHVHTTSQYAKASLNGPLAHIIFEECPDIQYVVHAHIDLPDAYLIPYATVPGTRQDVESVRDAVKQGHRIIQQKNHGVIILLEKIDDLQPLLIAQNIYSKNASTYDLAYMRFQQHPHFIRMVRKYIPQKDAKILDMCSGTGDVAKQLISDGYTHIELADQSAHMLSIAQKSLPQIPHSSFHIQALEHPYKHRYDAIVLRQAINYVDEEYIYATLQHIYNALHAGGVCIFNTFDGTHLHSGTQDYNTYNEHYRVKTHEGNLVEEGTIYHGQIAHIYSRLDASYTRIYDLNKFALHDLRQTQEIMKLIGFEVTVLQEKTAYYFIGRK